MTGPMSPVSIVFGHDLAVQQPGRSFRPEAEVQRPGTALAAEADRPEGSGGRWRKCSWRCAGREVGPGRELLEDPYSTWSQVWSPFNGGLNQGPVAGFNWTWQGGAGFGIRKRRLSESGTGARYRPILTPHTLSGLD